MPIRTHTLSIPGATTMDGLWLYVLRVESPEGELIYVGMTGSNNGTIAKSPFRRFWIHIDRIPKNSTTYSVFKQSPCFADIDPWQCGEIRMVAVGPIFPATTDKHEFDEQKRKILAMERELINDLSTTGYQVINEISKRRVPDPELWQRVRAEFAVHFPKLNA
ncbi:MAG: hypothetical protein F4W95_12340 [Chloroflexi bacterium]|nr:hypothetical protein [Chloroflexota bacterium]MYD49255.1 hypothetical protein [Chloroflexota bacterium]